MPLLPISMVIATRDRPQVLARTMEGFLEDDHLPAEVILVDASENQDYSREIIPGLAAKGVRTRWIEASRPGAASQRNEGVALAGEKLILFADDDIIPEAGCLKELHDTLSKDSSLGGVGSMITNQMYSQPGRLSLILHRWFSGEKESRSFAGRCIGPARNLLPSDDPSLPERNRVDWLNTTCTLYRREALPAGPFDEFFDGASICEDLALSLHVGRDWELANCRSARIFHDSQPGAHKSRVSETTAMSLRNRHYIMTSLLQRKSVRDLAQLGADSLHEVLGTASSGGGLAQLPERLLGLARGWQQIYDDRQNHAR